MANDPRIRASDADRDRTAALLREHLAAGRLNEEEFNERLDKAYAAKTLGDLDQLLSDLPGIDLYHLPDHSVERRGPSGFGLPWLLAPRGARGISPAWRAAWGSWATVSLIAFLAWLLSGHPANLWFLWVGGVYGIILAGRWLSGGPVSAVSTHGPSGVMATVCSKWADQPPSSLTTVQPSSSRRVFGLPSTSSGSMARAMPSASTGPRPGRP